MTTPDPRDIQAELTGAQNELEASKLLLEKGLLAQAVSSAYYAVFHAARAAVWSRGKNAKRHRGLAHLFGEEFIKSGEMEALYSNILTGHREKREMADYDPVDFHISREETLEVWQDAEKFVERVKEVVAV